MTSDRRKRRREALKAEVKAQLVPRLLSLGFESTRTRSGKAAWGEEWKYYGYGRRRNGFVELVDISWERYGAPLFQLQYSRCREDEMGKGSLAESLRNGGVVPPLTGLERLFGRFRLWFGAWQSPETAVEQAIEGLPQLEEFFRSDIPGAQVYLTQSGDGRFVIDPHAPLAWMGWVVGVLAMPFQFIAFVFRAGDVDRRRSRAAKKTN